ncbi:MAG: hypothetical protein ABSE83_04795 [Methanobacterium sp.]
MKEDDKMDDKGFAFTPLTFLLLVPVMILAISYNGIINEVNTISAIAIGGDVTISIANNIATVIDEDTGDAGRYSALIAVQTVVNNTNLLAGNDPFFNQTPGNNSTTFIINNVVSMLNNNLTNTCIDLENQTGRTIYLNNIPINANSTNITVLNSSNLQISQNDPYGFTITVSSLPISIVQNGQNVTIYTPVENAYVSIQGLEDPYIWVNTKERNSSVIWPYPYYTNTYNTGIADYHFADQVSAGNLNNLMACLEGSNASGNYINPYYFPDPHGLSFFDRLENRTNNTSGSPASARMSTFIIYDVLSTEHGNQQCSMIDHEYFSGVAGSTIKAKGSVVTVPSSTQVFIISPTYASYLGLNFTYNT